MSKELSIEQVQALMKSVAENHLGELTLECEGYRLKIKGAAVAAQTVAAAPVCTTSTVAVAAVETTAQCPAPVADSARYLTSPIVGTFYASASPDKEAFAVVGKRLEVGDTAFIVESMKVMNEVPTELCGTVAEILLENGAPVEFGQPIIRME